MKKLAYIAFALLGLIWGSNFIFVKWAAEYVTPSQIVLLRVLFGLVPVLLYAVATKALSWRHARHLHHFVVMSLLATTVYYLAFAKGTVLLPSSVAGMLSGAIPLFTFICAFLFLREEPLNMQSAAGVALGFLGVLTIARPWTAATFDVHGVLYMIAGSLSVGCSFVYAKKFITPLGLPAAALTTYQIGIGAVLLVLVTDFNGLEAVFKDQRAWMGLVFGLGLCGTGLAYVMYYFVVDKLGAVTAASSTYLPPLVALVIGLFIGETLDGPDLTAMVLILAGVAIVQTAGRKPPRLRAQTA
ncbi:DMT family transporter [Ensifer canadensis]